ncbi:hypothetical protein BD408DRAFT_423196, partial [Parasitella parasitica]
SKHVQFVFIIAGIICFTSLIVVSITRKRYTGWRVPSAVVHSGIIIYNVSSFPFSLDVKWMAYH